MLFRVPLRRGMAFSTSTKNPPLLKTRNITSQSSIICHQIPATPIPTPPSPNTPTGSQLINPNVAITAASAHSIRNIVANASNLSQMLILSTPDNNSPSKSNQQNEAVQMRSSNSNSINEIDETIAEAGDLQITSVAAAPTTSTETFV